MLNYNLFDDNIIKDDIDLTDQIFNINFNNINKGDILYNNDGYINFNGDGEPIGIFLKKDKKKNKLTFVSTKTIGDPLTSCYKYQNIYYYVKTNGVQITGNKEIDEKNIEECESILENNKINIYKYNFINYRIPNSSDILCLKTINNKLLNSNIFKPFELIMSVNKFNKEKFINISLKDMMPVVLINSYLQRIAQHLFYNYHYNLTNIYVSNILGYKNNPIKKNNLIINKGIPCLPFFDIIY